ncbi:E3 ubiquitin-protein ligase TRIM47-like [Alosa sapidissima]|uniref:E3 ubiquitin-protein ligase TRIM47-like n=1 Tax=Alosa sapidissima TaxID=34773 RepID=UPI001C08E605|nr:E3 ubiquitin-protein ligase TRIM47-like [Alosa sapidissima]
MAEAISQEEDSFTCPVCRDLLKDPVTIHCGHNFCKRCIKGCWDQEDQKGVYSCPLCKHTFTPRPVLYKNPLIAEMIEKFGKTGIQATVPAQCYAGPGDVECDVCTGRKLKAVKSCLECLVSYCEDHFKDHNRLNRGRKHSVIATGQLQERTCSEHKKEMEVFCRTDQKYICYKCMMKEHKDHDTVTVEEEWKNKQKQLKKNQRRIQERERELQEQLKAVKIIKSSAQTAVEDSERIFTEMICSIVRRYTEVSRAEGLLKKLEQEIAELKRREAVLEQLSHTEDHVHFLKIIPSIRELPHSKDLITLSQIVSSEAVKESVSALKVQLEEKMDSTFKQQILILNSQSEEQTRHCHHPTEESLQSQRF